MAAWALVLAACLAVFGQATVHAVEILLDPGGELDLAVSSGFVGWPSRLMTTGVAIGVAVVTVLVARAPRGLDLSVADLGLGGLRRGFPARALGAVAAAYAVMFVATFAEGLAVNVLFPGWYAAGVGGGETAEPPLAAAVSGLGNGFSEELLLLALPLAVVTRLRWAPWAALLVLVALRLPFHLWHGPAAMVLVVAWMLGFLWLWRRVGSVWPFVVAHLLTYVLVGPYPTPVRLTLLAVSLALVAGGVVAMVRAARRPEPVPAPR